MPGTTGAPAGAAGRRWICSQCGWIYDPALGDELNGVAPGVAFPELPAEWVCPMCYAKRDAFDPLD